MSDPDPTLEEARRWLRFSKEDLAIGQRLLTERPSSPRHACFLFQQAAEKALKAALVLEGIDFPFTHDLDALRNLFPDGWPTQAVHADLAELTEWGVETRYPGDWPEPTDADGRRAESDARAVYESVEREFSRRGVDTG